ncbi:MAG: hypothetical protein DHS20C01_14170 [marine bacterium B5-7]|nr:MAG: hypothetical protein DHS20C01_14170 [marine bacterium B5-7]
MVEKHDIKCDADFPCPGELRRRTDFWIEVYSKWTSSQGVFHDSRYPERVYSVIDITNGCRDSSSAVTRERKRIDARLGEIAQKIQNGQRIRDKEDRAILALFPNPESKSIRAARRYIRCQQGNRDRFEDALKRYGAYGPMVKQLIKSAGLNEDIHYLPFVESLYNPRAYSRVGAAGLWQIMPKTARYLGLQIDATVDERLDMEAATIAATRYLKDSRSRLTAVARQKNPSVSEGAMGPFVITSYNYGVNGMRRAVDQIGPDFISVLNHHKSPSFQVAVKNFYTSFLAARHVARNARRYFGDVPPEPTVRYQTAVLKYDTSMKRIIDVFGVDEDELKDLNRALTRFVWHGWRFAPAGYRLRLPYRQQGWDQAVSKLESKGPESDVRGPVNYKVRKGDTACGIARAFHVKCNDLVDMNRLGRRAFIRVGQNLVIPGKLGSVGGTKSTSKQATKSTSKTATTKVSTYRVKPGDSPCGIARRMGVDCREMLNANGLGRQSVIYAGQTLKLPGVGESSTLTGQSRPRPATYTVKSGDTACEIAEQFDVPCDQLMDQNGLGRKSILRLGQTLKLPGTGVVNPNTIITAESSTSSPGKRRVEVAYRVEPGDTPCQIAERHKMSCAQFQKLNNLKRHSVIYVGQMVKVFDDVVVESGVAVVTDTGKEGSEVSDTAGEASVSPLDGEIDLAVLSRTRNGVLQNYILVESEETLGHYADWLGIGSMSPISDLNKIGMREVLKTGELILLPVKTDEQKQQFQNRRAEYHRVLVEEFKEAYEIQNVNAYTVRVGDSAWKIASKFQLPLWVVNLYNPELRSRSPAAGETLKIPQIEPRG